MSSEEIYNNNLTQHALGGLASNVCYESFLRYWARIQSSALRPHAKLNKKHKQTSLTRSGQSTVTNRFLSQQNILHGSI